MSIQQLLTTESAILGFIASLFFIVGSITMSGKTIKTLSGTYWDYNKHIAKALSRQRAEYISGALALCLAFLFQLVVSVLPSSILELSLFSTRNSVLLIVLVFLGTVLLALYSCRNLCKSTYKKVLLERRIEEAEYQNLNSRAASNEKI